jgi:uncharacterized protein
MASSRRSGPGAGPTARRPAAPVRRAPSGRPAAPVPPRAPVGAAEPVDPVALAETIDAWSGPGAPLPLPMLDGFLVGTLLQPRRVPFERCWPALFDGEPPPPRGPAAEALHDALRRRHTALDDAIERRQWFDPWILEPSEGATPHDAVYPWVAGFAHAMATFEDLGDTDDPAFDEPLALLYQHLDPDDLEEADTLLELIGALAEPQDLAEAVEQLVRATLLIADETRPQATRRRS